MGSRCHLCDPGVIHRISAEIRHTLTGIQIMCLWYFWTVTTMSTVKFWTAHVTWVLKYLYWQDQVFMATSKREYAPLESRHPLCFSSGKSRSPLNWEYWFLCHWCFWDIRKHFHHVWASVFNSESVGWEPGLNFGALVFISQKKA